jgi:hypothetical protein
MVMVCLWRVRWADGSETPQACFDARAADEHPAAEWLTMEDPRARAIIGDVPRFVAGQPLPVVRVTGLPESVNGIWSLWEIGSGRARCEPQAVPAGLHQ